MALTEYGKNLFNDYFDEIKQISYLFTKEEMQDLTQKFMDNKLDKEEITSEINRRIDEAIV